MKPISACLVVMFLAGAALSQTPADAAKPASRAMIEGIVIKEPGSEPVKKALIELIADNQTEGGDYTAITGPDGSFHIEAIVPGRYHLFAERTGLLDASKRHARSEGRVLTLSAGQELKDVQIRLQAAAVIRGRVTDEDGDPLPNAEITVLRETFTSGHRHWQQVGGERANDLGEYRVAGLDAGNYYVSCSPPPDFKSLIENSGTAHSDPNPAPDKASPSSYQTTYYPGTNDRSQAAAIQLRAGDDYPVNFSLTPSPSLTIRGSVVNLPPRSSAVIMLQSRDFNVVLNGADIRKDGSFVIHDVSPGNYTVTATVDNVPVPMMARQSLQVAGNVDGLRLAPQPGSDVRGRLRIESRSIAGFDPTQIFLSLRSADATDETLTIGDQFTNIARVEPDGSFDWKDVPAGNYYVQLIGEDNVNADLYVRSTLAAGRDVNDSSISINGGVVSLNVVVSANGAVIEGVVSDAKGQPFANAIVVAVPETSLRSREDRYRNTVADQSGRFTLHGLPPGNYTLFAWESVEGEAYYDPEFLKLYEGQGSAMRLNEGDHKNVQLQLIPDMETQP